MSAEIDTRGNEKPVSYLEAAVDWALPGDNRQINQTGAQLLKTTAIFLPGKIGYGASAALHAADQASPADSGKQQLTDVALGAAKGALLRGVLDVPLHGGIASRGVALGMANRSLDAAFERRNYYNERTGNFDFTTGMKRAASTAFNPYALAVDVGTMGAAAGAQGLAGQIGNGILLRRPLYASVLTGSVFGFAGGAGGELMHEVSSGQGVDFGKVLRAGGMNALITGIAAAPGGLMREHSLKNTQFIVIGGGPHGVQQALQIAELGGSRNVTVVDPNPQLLAQWKHATANVEMTHLRSPQGHYIGSEPIVEYAARRGAGDSFAGPSRRPALQVFNEHADAQIRTGGIQHRHLQTTATGVRLTPSGVEIKTDLGTIRGRYLVLATGPGELNYPQFAVEAQRAGARVDHIFDPRFNISSVKPAERVAVVGGGISGAQVTDSLADRGARVTWITRSPHRFAETDFTPEFATPAGVQRLLSIPPEQRAQTIRENSHPGTIPSWERSEIEPHLASGRVEHRVADVNVTTIDTRGRVALGVAPDAARHQPGTSFGSFDRILLATGFRMGRPGGALVDQLVTRYQFPVGPEGLPITNGNLQWADNVFVSGPLARLTIGPASNNIVGAQLAARLMRAPVASALGKAHISADATPPSPQPAR